MFFSSSFLGLSFDAKIDYSHTYGSVHANLTDVLHSECSGCVGSWVCKPSSRCNINGVWRHCLPALRGM